VLEKRAKLGSSFIELAAGLMVLIPLVLYGVNAATIYMGASMNTDYCREACRAAANGPPTSYSDQTNTPTARANQVLSNKYNPSGIIQVPPNLVAGQTVTEQVFDPKPQAPFGGPVRGVVTVQTTVTVLPPMPLPGMPQKVVLNTQQTFPFTWNMPGQFAQGGAGAGSTAGQNNTGAGGSSAGGGASSTGGATPSTAGNLNGGGIPSGGSTSGLGQSFGGGGAASSGS
jgi:hypothetical protein